MTKRTYSQEIASAIHTFLVDDDWKFRFDEDNGVFHYTVSRSGKIKLLHYMIPVHENGFTVSARYPLGPNPGDETVLISMVKFLTRINYILRNGNFEMDLEDGEIRYKVYCPCFTDEVPKELIEEGIHCPAAMFKRFENGLLSILFDGKSDLEAFEETENKHHEMAAHLSSRLSDLLQSMRKKSEEEQTEPTEDDEFAPQSFAEFLQMLEDSSDKESNDDGNE